MKDVNDVKKMEEKSGSLLPDFVKVIEDLLPDNMNIQPKEEKPKQLAKIVVLRESLLTMRICTTIPPEEMYTINAELRMAGLAESGTSNGWTLDMTIKPVKCDAYADRWHYICKC